MKTGTNGEQQRAQTGLHFVATIRKRRAEVMSSPYLSSMSLTARSTLGVIGKVALCAALAGLPSASPAQLPSSIPDSLSDREFWRLFTTTSEEGGSFPSENFVSNEKTYQYVIPTLQRTLSPHGVYLGVGPEQNFTYIVNLEPRLAVIFDIRRQNAMLHLMYKALFELSPTRAAFVSRLFSRPLQQSIAATATPAETFAAVSTAAVSDSAFGATWAAIVDRLTVRHGFTLSDSDVVSMRRAFESFREAGPQISYAFRLGSPPPSVTQWYVTYAQLQTLTNGDSVNMGFLSTEDRYSRLRRMEQRNLIVPVVGDFAGPKAIRAVGEYLKQHDARVTAFYTSNVEQYLFVSRVDGQFYRNVETLPIDSTSLFIRAVPPDPIANSLIPQLMASVPPNVRDVSVQIRDSSGVRILVATGVDSAGKAVVRRMVDSGTTATITSTSAFISGIAPMARTLKAFSSGQLTSYQQVTAMTKTTEWKSP